MKLKELEVGSRTNIDLLVAGMEERMKQLQMYVNGTAL